MTISHSRLCRTGIFLVVAGLLPSAVSAAAASAPTADTAARIRAIVDGAIRPLMAAHDVPGMAVAVTIDGRPYYFNYGLASREQNTPMPVTEVTLFELGSVSKMLTTTLASYAQVTGKLSLDDHPGKYMPQLKGSAIDKATLMHLGTYSPGGLPLQFPDGVTDDTMVNYFQTLKPDAAPGAQRRYSNPSLGLLGHVTALAMKRDFADALEKELFPKLGMTQTFVRTPHSAMKHQAWGYDKANKAIRMNPGVFAAQAYGVRSGSADVLRFVQANLEPARLDKQLRRTVEATQVGYFKVGQMVQGFGWEQYPYPVALDQLLSGNSYDMILEPQSATRIEAPKSNSLGTLFNKTGSTSGFGNYVMFVPEKKIGIVMLANKNYPIPVRVRTAYAILEQLAPSSAKAASIKPQ